MFSVASLSVLDVLNTSNGLGKSRDKVLNKCYHFLIRIIKKVLYSILKADHRKGGSFMYSGLFLPVPRLLNGKVMNEG